MKREQLRQVRQGREGHCHCGEQENKACPKEAAGIGSAKCHWPSIAISSNLGEKTPKTRVTF